MHFQRLQCPVFERLIPALSLPDPDDRHVLAAAVHARADLIVTVNLKNFTVVAFASQSPSAVFAGAFCSDNRDHTGIVFFELTLQYRERRYYQSFRFYPHTFLRLDDSLPKCFEGRGPLHPTETIGVGC